MRRRDRRRGELVRSRPSLRAVDDFCDSPKMFRRLQTRHFRNVKAVDQAFGSVQALVGSNASGKKTLLYVTGVLSDYRASPLL